jgi:SAM-dependent methyltransferase
MSETNAAQAEYWNSSETRHWVDNQVRYDEMLVEFGARVLDAARIESGSKVLDVGCGSGTTTLHAARAATDGRGQGIDISRAMVEHARARAAAERVENVSFEVADAQTSQFDARFDAVISRFGVMFFEDPVAAFATMRRSTAQGGRLSFACWREAPANEWMRVPFEAALRYVPPPQLPAPGEPGPYSLADAGDVRRILEGAEWRDIHVEPIDVPVLLGGRGTVDDAVEFIRKTGMGRMLLADTNGEAADQAVEAVRDALAEHHNGEGVQLGASAWLVTARRD